MSRKPPKVTNAQERKGNEMSEYTWTWKDATPRERGAWVRVHLPICRDVNALCKLFNLTPEGAQAILDGADWAPEHEEH